MSLFAYNQSTSYPLASHQFFKDNWEPAIQAQNLEMLSGLVDGIYIEVTPENWQQFGWELQQVNEWAAANLQADIAAFMNERIHAVLNGMPDIFAQPDAKMMVS